MITDHEDRVAVLFSRAITRSRFLQKGLRYGVALGAATTGTLFGARVARAGSCGVGVRSDWGCYCASTMTCPGGPADCAPDFRRRCTRWTSFPYCWCSLTCCYPFGFGYYSCCDCWTGGSGDCGTPSSGEPCVAKHLHIGASC